MSLDSKEVRLTDFPAQDRPPVAIPFFSFRIMVGCWAVMLLMVGALVEGLPSADGYYIGGNFGWFSPFPVLCGAGLRLGYMLLGACWLVKKCQAETRDSAHRLIPYMAGGTLAISFWPYMIPFSITTDAAAAPHSSLAFMFWGKGLFVFPLMLLYTVISYTVFRGKLKSSEMHY
jgi:cytochrome bd-type quinol oxidase subunit 2